MLRPILLLLTGCSWHSPYPPPSALPVAAVPLEAGEKALHFGTSGLVSGSGEVMLDPLGGLALGGVGFGLSDTLDLRLTTGPVFRGVTAGGQLGWTVRETDRWSLGLTGGLAGARISGLTTQQGDVDEAGEPSLTSVEFPYLSLAGSVGGRALLKLDHGIAVPFQLRTSYSRMFSWGDSPGDDYGMPWIEGGTGVILGTRGKTQFAVDAQILALQYPGMGWDWAISPSVSLGRKLGPGSD